MNGGFKPLLDACEFQFGATDDAPVGDDGQLEVTLRPTGTSKSVYQQASFDAIGIYEQAGVTMLLGFDWLTLDEAAVRELAEQQGVTDDEQFEAEFAELRGEDLLVLTVVFPWREVLSIGVGGGLLGVFS